MRATRRVWGTALSGVAVTALGVLAETAVLLIAGLTIAAWLIGRQLQALRLFRQLESTIDISVATPRTSVSIEESVRLAVTVELDTPTPAPLTIVVPQPLGATGADREDRTLTLEKGATSAATTFECSFPTAGRYNFPTPQLTIGPVDGLFSETLSRGETPTIRAEPRTPADLHVGKGGEALALSYGQHPAGRGSGGLSPEELRQYQPGDSTDRIDWKATARHGDLYVREFEAESDRQTVICLDHRARTDTGPDGATLFAYTREVALGFIEGAAGLSDPVGCWTVGDAGITGQFEPTSSSAGYDRIRTHIQDLTPTTATDTDPSSIPDDSDSEAAMGTPATNGHATSSTLPSEDHAVVRPATARARNTRLGDEQTDFATRLRPFFENQDSYVQRLQGDPLFQTVERMQASTAGTTLSVIITDDANRDRLREAVRLATRRGNYAFVFIAPQLLFTDDRSLDVEAEYEQYIDFEEFRRSLEGIPRVTAFEVGPGDRLDGLLATRRR